MNFNEDNARRSFLKKASIGGLVTLVTPQAVLAGSTQKAAKIRLSKDDVVLFQGDSITDAGRKKDSSAVNDASALGMGYAMLAASALLNDHADKNLKIYNRGISGNKVYQLAERWEKDCLDLKPNVLSILIGVNDYWHKHSGKYDATVKVYQNDLKKLLDRTLKQFPDVKLILGEPFAVKGVKAVDDTWYPEFNDYRAAAAAIANEYNAAWIPYQKVFDAAEKTASGSYWTRDGVHPSVAGAQLMANAWLDVIK
jgi:lysophospholipase L1-like esterase